MAGSRLKAVCVDCVDGPQLARWWAPVLGYELRPYDEESRAWLADRGLTPETDPAVALDPPDGSGGPTVWFNTVPEPKSAKVRVHLDVYGDWRQIVAAGATLVQEGGVDPDVDWTVLADPEGNEFCVFAPPS